MDDTAKVTLAAAVVGGYVLGRTKKGRLALTIATYLAGKRFGLEPRQLAAEGMRRLGEIPQFAELQEQLKGEVLDAGRKAVTAAADRGMSSLADALSDRTARLGERRDEGEDEGGEEEEEPEEEEPEEEGQPEDEYDEEEYEEEEAPEETQPQRRSTRRSAQPRREPRGGAARKKAAPAQGEKPRTAKKTAARKTAPAKKTATRKTAPSKRAASKRADRRR
ncbi:histone protein [Streptomyces sp. NBC_01363]|uniref:histone protein n=1 Tax=Streptomyces sp. NBC_01363 TaxID=2903840 RepID=UPI0022536549|nr:histone protein [Streptomyces sp. NBC_01363]MCX4729446.1 histone protein [Streptomyces sp. NBC_01363]MCX4736908.1 histone protein [Streptomyces sp. NBC_01363]